MTKDPSQWQQVWNFRMKGLESKFGKCDSVVLHAQTPFEVGLDLGGSPDVVSFSAYTEGKLYVTADLIGSTQHPNSHGNYELAIAHRGKEDWGIEIICRLAYYSLTNVLDHGETMDIAEAVPRDSTIAALLFRRIAVFRHFRKPANVLCCIGITPDELNFCLERRATAFFTKIPSGWVLTEMSRRSFLAGA